MATYISLVGLQPAAVAVPLASWLKAHPDAVDQIILLPTEKTLPIANRLAAWVKAKYGLSWKPQAVSDSMVAQNGLLPPHEIVRDFVNAYPSEKTILFNADPGLNFHVAAVGAFLPTNSIILHTRADRLYSLQMRNGVQSWNEHALADLGLKVLLDLYEVDFEFTGKCSEEIMKYIGSKSNAPVEIGLKLRTGKILFDLAFERGGHLYCLHHLRTRANSKTRLAAFRDLERERHDWKGLQPRLTVYSGDSGIMTRSRRARFQALNSKSKQAKRRMEKWLNRDVPTPKDLETMSFLSQSGPKLIRSHGNGGNGLPLVVCLGNDPSSTLVSLCTHKPRKAWICVDQNTKSVLEVAIRLQMTLPDLPVGEVNWVPTDVLGRNIYSVLQSQLVPPSIGAKVDISPGTKAHGLALGRLAGLNPKVDIWSLKTRDGKATPLFERHSPSEPLDLDAPSIRQQAQIVGGPLFNQGRIREALRGEAFFDLLLKFFEQYIEEQKQSGTPGAQISNNIRMKNISCQFGSLKKIGAKLWQVCIDGSKGRISVDFKGGFFLENLTAIALHQAGADEIVVGLKWDWPIPSKRIDESGKVEYNPMDEVDVLAKFGHRFVALSCKADDKGYAKYCREIEAVALMGMGRLCVPFLVKPLLPDHLISERLTSRSQAALLDLRYLADPVKLKDALLTKFKAMSAGPI